MNRDDIHIISRNSNWSESGVSKALRENVWSDIQLWKKFLQLLFISLGIGFTISGIIFFFAFNWADLNKFVKIGMIEGLIIIAALTVLLSKIQPFIKNTILTGAAVLVGVLIAVFGQIYQTGANSFDFMLTWTAMITLWVIVSNFPPLWLIYLLLVNITIGLYAENVAQNWPPVSVFAVLFLLISLVLILSLLRPGIFCETMVPLWFINTIVLGSVSIATTGMINGIFLRNVKLFDLRQSWFLLLILLTAVFYAAGIIYGLQKKSGFYLSVLSFSLIIIITALFLRISSRPWMMLIATMFIIGSVTTVVSFLINLQKKLTNE